MDIKLQSALISATVSIIAAVIAYFTVKRQSDSQREKTEKEHASKFLQNAYDLRLKHYPKAFEITEQVSKLYSLDTNETIAAHNELADKLREWRNSEVMLVISDYALNCSYGVERELRKKPHEPNSSFSEKQIKRMWGKRQKFRHSLRRDLALFLNTE